MMRHKLYTWRTECHSKSYRLPVVVGDLLFDWWTSALICSSALICNSSGRQSCICLLVHRSLLYPSSMLMSLYRAGTTIYEVSSCKLSHLMLSPA